MDGAESKLCTKCESSLDTKGFPLWCKKCQNDYRKQYNAIRKQMAEKNGFALGVQAMRDYLANEFAKYPQFQRFDGPSIARTIRSVAAPPLPADQSPVA